MSNKEQQEQQEKQLIEQYKKTGSKIYKDKLVLSLEPIARSFVKKWKTSKIQVKDIYAIAIEGILMAIEQYQLESSGKISSYAHTIIHNLLFVENKKLNRDKRQNNGIISYDVSLKIQDDSKDTTLIEMLAHEVDDYYRASVRLDVQLALKKLEPQQLYIIQSRFGFGGREIKSYEELARELGYKTGKSVSRRERKALDQLREQLKDYSQIYSEGTYITKIAM